MRIPRVPFHAALALLPAVLSAQDPTATMTLTQRLKASEPEISKLMAALDAKAALAKCEALLPASKPAFNKSNPKAGLDSSQEYSSLMALYGLAAKAAISAGDWEKGKAYLEKAQDIARENSAETTAVVTPIMETWKKAMESSKKALEEGAARRQELEAKEKDKRTPDEQRELDNFRIHDNNLKNGPNVIASLQGNLDGLKSDAAGFESPITSLDKKIKEEAETMVKFKGDRAAYVKAVLANKANLSGIEKPADKAGWLNRLLFLAPANAQAQKQLDIVLGKAPAEPEKKKSAKPKKKA
jgi:hypothetical protein